MNARIQMLASLLLTFATTSVAQAAVNTKANLQDATNQIVASVVERPRVLVGMTNVERALGSTTFSLPMSRITNGQRVRTELRATLRETQVGSQIPMGASSNPEAFHMDINYLKSASDLATPGLRLVYRGQHTTPVSTRVLTYEASVNSMFGQGRLVATVQQRAVPDQKIWKTTAAFVRFVPN